MRRVPAYPLYLATYSLLGMLLAVAFTTNLVYQVEIVGLDPLQLVLVGTVLEATTFIFEVPTGVLADVYGRRLSVIVGTALLGAGFTLEGAVPRFAAVLVAQVVWGFRHTFVSGALTAWLADEIGEARLPAALMRGAQLFRIGSLAGIALSVALASIDRSIPLVVAGVALIVMAAVLAGTMPELGFQRIAAGERHALRDLCDTAVAGVVAIRRRRVLMVVLVIALLYAPASEALDRLTTPFLLDTITLPRLGPLDPVAWFGLMAYVATAASLLILEVVHRRVDLEDDRAVARALLLLNTVLIGAVAAFALAGNLAFALAAFWIFSPLRRVNEPIIQSWQNRFIPSAVRATVLSLGVQVDAIGQIAGGPLLGALAVGLSVRAALLAAALIMLPALAIYVLLLRGAQRAAAAIE